MAEVSSAYVDLGKFWTYDPKSKSKESQFYDNAWIIGDKPIEGTKSLPAAYFYVKGEKDNVGFTPTSIDYDARSGLLSVQGRQEGVDRILQRAYMMNAPAPRFMRVRASERSRRPADLVVKNIIVDMEDSMPNIKAYLGIETEEKEVEDLSQDEDFFNMKGLDYGAEEFEAPKPQLTKNQLKLLDYIKVSAFNRGGRDAYVKTDRKGYDGFKPQLVQKLIDKGIISTSEGSGRIESLKAYIVKLNPIAWEYPFRYGGDKSLKQRGNKIVRNMKIHREETARKLEKQRRRDNMTFDEVYAELFGAEGGEQYDYYTIEQDNDEGYMNARVPTLKTNRLFDPLYYTQHQMMNDMSDRISTAFHPNAEVREQSGYGTREKQRDAIFNGLKSWNEQMIEDLNGVKRSIDMELGDRKFEAELFGAEDDWWQTNPNFWEYVAINYGHLFDEEGHYVPQRPEQELEIIAQEWIPLYVASKKMPMSAETFDAEEDFEVVSVNVGYSIPPERREDGKWMSFGDVVFELSDGKISRISTFGSGDEKSEAREKLVERAKSYLMEEEGF